MGGDGRKSVVEDLDVDLAMLQQLIEYPQDTVMFDYLNRCEAPKFAVSGEKNSTR